MYLKAIKAYGFKSFADKLTIDFDKDITAIVGPNGSGKSNIVDAVKWVLGEQSVKQLRATDSMTDVIFSGSKTRDGLTRASVTLVFDNTDHYLNCDFEEVEIKRIVYKTGENEYYLNNVKVRLKDITNLFLDSGAGSDSFNIISQGSVQDIINSKPEGRRSIFEAAAGVLKYKKRKEESLRKLEKTKDNINTVNLLIEELKQTIEPLEKQSKVAKIYLETKANLENVEISLTAREISDLKEQELNLKRDIQVYENDLLKLGTVNTSDAAAIEALKIQILKLEEDISKINDEYLKICNLLADKLSQKQVMLERQKYEVSKEKIENSLIELKEQELNLKKHISLDNKEIASLEEEKQKFENDKEVVQNDYLKAKVNKSNLYNDLVVLNKKNMTIKNEIEALEFVISADNKVPVAVKAVLNRQMPGVYDRIGKLINVKDEYLNAIDVALGASSNFIVAEDESVVKSAIFYLKTAGKGRATFFPLSVIKSRYIDHETLMMLKGETGFIDVAANLVSYDNKFKNIIENQLGNVIVVSDLDALNKIGKLINYRYRIVSLDGEILHSGGSVTGGSLKTSDSLNYDKLKLKGLKVQAEEIEKNYLKYQLDLDNLEKDIVELENKINEYNQEILIVNQKLLIIKEKNLSDSEKLKLVENEIIGMTSLNADKTNEEVLKIIDECNELETNKKILEKDLINYKNKRSELNDLVSKQELEAKQNRSEYNEIQKHIYENESLIGKIEVKLENYLNTLSENYNISYERAIDEYYLEIPVEEARKKIVSYRKSLFELGDVNTGAVKEYDRLKTRYDFLTAQKEDLDNSCESLLQMISDMDEIMIEKFKESFDKINNEFHETFKKLFKGGKGYLKLTNPDDLLTTGVDIIAEPPGKKLNSIALLSGGEKTLTAIALLFAILNVKTVPFCIFDEVEAALDELNVATFGEYLKAKKDKSQFILITHKKKTMEYADALYGITMQESGVSKIVSVKLED